MRSFTALVGLHEVLEDLFREHQRALLRFDFDLALRLLVQYERALLLHMRDEEELMLPIFNERAGYIRGGGTDLFLGEHQKMREMIEIFRERIERAATAEDRERSLLGLLDAETTFKHLGEHHHEREERYLYPTLDRVCSPDERESILARSARDLISDAVDHQNTDSPRE